MENDESKPVGFRVGNVVQRRSVTKQDLERWQQQRIKRKSKPIKLDPYR